MLFRKLPLIAALLMTMAMTDEGAAAGSPQVLMKTSMGEAAAQPARSWR